MSINELKRIVIELKLALATTTNPQQRAEINAEIAEYTAQIAQAQAAK